MSKSYEKNVVETKMGGGLRHALLRHTTEHPCLNYECKPKWCLGIVGRGGVIEVSQSFRRMVRMTPFHALPSCSRFGVWEYACPPALLGTQPCRPLIRV